MPTVSKTVGTIFTHHLIIFFNWDTRGSDRGGSQKERDSKTTHLDAHVSEDEVDAVVGALVVLEPELSVSVDRVEPTVLKRKGEKEAIVSCITSLDTTFIHDAVHD